MRTLVLVLMVLPVFSCGVGPKPVYLLINGVPYDVSQVNAEKSIDAGKSDGTRASP